MTMVEVPGGPFIMGRYADALHGDDPNASPPHEVYLDGFYIDRYEVTTAGYAAFLRIVGTRGSDDVGQIRFVPNGWDQLRLPPDRHRPVVGLSWQAADFYCRWLGKRLPTEAEWEKAARGSDRRVYPWGDRDPTATNANYGNPGGHNDEMDGLRSVDSYEQGRSPYGVFNMAGNAAEWVADWYDARYYDKAPDNNPHGPTTGVRRVVRGGSFADLPSGLRTTARQSADPRDSGTRIGIRCASDTAR
jgi:formylglycine-generating enzyme required for sulfatase activity